MRNAAALVLPEKCSCCLANLLSKYRWRDPVMNAAFLWGTQFAKCPPSCPPTPSALPRGKRRFEPPRLRRCQGGCSSTGSRYLRAASTGSQQCRRFLEFPVCPGTSFGSFPAFSTSCDSFKNEGNTSSHKFSSRKRNLF